ncbi:hypothetical protein P691DRAFT_639880, partial [Macrolepiota fuliginosa MF-IS2]
LQPKTIKGYLSAVRPLHVNKGLPFTSTESPTVQHVIRGIKRYFGEHERNPKAPITLPLLQKICLSTSSFAPTQDFRLLFQAAATIAWAGFLRCGEFTLPENTRFDPTIHLSQSCLSFHPSISNPTHI